MRKGPALLFCLTPHSSNSFEPSLLHSFTQQQQRGRCADAGDSLGLMRRKIARTAKARQNEGFGIEAGGEVDSSGSPRQQPRADAQSEYNFNVSCCW